MTDVLTERFAAQWSTISRFDSTTIPPLKRPADLVPSLGQMGKPQRAPMNQPVKPKVNTSPNRPTKGMYDTPPVLKPAAEAFKSSVGSLKKQAGSAIGEAKADIASAPAKVKDWTKNTLIPDAKKLVQDTKGGSKQSLPAKPDFGSLPKPPSLKPKAASLPPKPVSSMPNPAGPKVAMRPVSPLALALPKVQPKQTAGAQIPTAQPQIPTANSPNSTPATQQSAPSHQEYLLAKRQQKIADHQEELRLKSRSGTGAQLARSAQGFTRRGSLADRFLQHIARKSDMATKTKIDQLRQSRVPRDMEFERQYQQSKAQQQQQGKGKQSQSGQSQQPANPDHGFSATEVKQLKDLGLDDKSIREHWQSMNSGPSNAGKASRQPESKSPPLVNSQKNENTADKSQVPPLVNPLKVDQPEDPTGLGHDPELSPHDSRHEFLLPNQAKKYHEEADQFYKSYQQTGSEEDAAKAASRVRQLKLHGYDHNLPHSKQGIIDRHQKSQETKQDKELMRQWHDVKQQLRANPDDKFSKAALENIEKHFGKKNIDVKQSVAKSIEQNKAKQFKQDITDFQDAWTNATPAAREGRTPQFAGDMPQNKNQHEANRKLDELKKRFKDNKVDVHQLLKTHSPEFYEKQFAPVSEARKRAQESQLQQRQAQSQPKPQPPKTVISPSSPPPMEHPAHHTPEQRQESEQIRNKMVEESRKIGAQSDPLFDSDDSDSGSSTKDPYLAWKGQKASSYASSPIDKAIIAEVGDDAILHKIIKEQIQSVSGSFGQDRNEAIRNTVQNIIPKERFSAFMLAARKAEDVNQIPRFDEIVETIKLNPSLSAALVGKGRTDSGDLEEQLFQSLKSGMSDNPNTLRSKVQQAIESMGGHGAIDDIMNHYYGTQTTNDNIPFSADDKFIQRFAAHWQLNRFLNCPYSISIDQFGTQGKLFSEDDFQGRVVPKQTGRTWRTMQTKSHSGAPTVRAPKGGAHDVVTGKWREGGKLISKPRYDANQKSLNLPDADLEYHKASTERLRQMAAKGDAQAGMELQKRMAKGMIPDQPIGNPDADKKNKPGMGHKGQGLLGLEVDQAKKEPPQNTGLTGSEKLPGTVQSQPKKTEAPSGPHQQVSKMADRHEAYARQTEGGTGLAVGSGHIDDRWKADSLRGMLRDVQSGMTPDQAAEKAKQTARQWIVNHNQRRPKDINWARWDGAVDSTIDTAARILNRGKATKPVSEVAKSRQTESPDDIIFDGTVRSTRMNKAREILKGSIRGNISAIDQKIMEAFGRRETIEGAIEQLKKEVPQAFKGLQKEATESNLNRLYGKKPFVYPNGQTQSFDGESPSSEETQQRRSEDSQAAARIEKSMEAINALPEGPAKQIATKMMEDFGDRLTGARKHSAKPQRQKTETPADDRPGWQRRYDVSQIARSSKKEEEGKFTIHDTKQKDWTGQHKMATRELFDSHEDAMAALPMIEVARNHRIRQMSDGTHAIVRILGDKRPVVKGGFASEEDAMKHMAKSPHEIIEHKFPSYEEYQYLENVVRDGKSVRKSNVDGNQFAKDFGFRGGEFGNWQSGADGQKSLNHAYDAMHDLATVLGLEPKHVGLNGDLAIAFGARGTGGKHSARAHYEPGQRVMNLTKMKGAGSLAHEWLHALDHMIAGGKDAPSHSSIATKSYALKHTRQELKDAVEKLRDAITVTSEEYIPDGSKHEEYANKAQDSIRRRFSELEQEWTSTYGKKNKKQLAQEELKEWNHIKEKVVRGDVGEKTYVGGRTRFGGTPSFEAIDRLNELHKKVTGRSFHKATGNQGLYSDIERQRIARKMVDEANEKKPKSRNRTSEFVKNAQKLDESRTSSYYTKHEELMARAFESYVEDKLQSHGIRSDYLIGKGKTAAGFWKTVGMPSPFPQGEERQRINAAFDALIDTLKQHEFKSPGKYSIFDQALVDRFTYASISHRYGLLTA